MMRDFFIVVVGLFAFLLICAQYDIIEDRQNNIQLQSGDSNP